MNKARWSGSGYQKATSDSDLPTYECPKHGPVKAIVRMRKSGYLHRRCHECYKIAQRRAVGAWNKRERTRCKSAVISAYGSACECCSESNVGLLSIDHIKNDGSVHRKEIKSGLGIYSWLLRNGCPRDGRFRLLCFNCNLGRAFNGGICPHNTSDGAVG